MRTRSCGYLRDAVAMAGAQVIFTDLPAGSWTIAARRVQRERPEVVVVTGANLPALLDFVFQTDCTIAAWPRGTPPTKGVVHWRCWAAGAGSDGGD